VNNRTTALDGGTFIKTGETGAAKGAVNNRYR
jgi:hypothetical protein